jgi:hypothetical protein
MRLRASTLGGVILLLVAGTGGVAQAQDDPNLRPGLYLGGGFTYAFPMFGKEVEVATARSLSVDSSIGANARLGYRITSWMAIEAQYEYVDGFTAKLKPGHQTAMDLRAQTVTGNVKLLVPASVLQPYLVLGGGGTLYDIKDRLGLGFSGSHWGVTGKAGIGFDLYLSPNWVLYIEGAAVFPTESISAPHGAQSLEELYYISTQIGIAYRF